MTVSAPNTDEVWERSAEFAPGLFVLLETRLRETRRLLLDALAQNDRLVDALHEAGEEIISLREELARSSWASGCRQR
jgi:hypothetical protein